MAKRILFLDDNKTRHRNIKHHLLHEEAYTAQEAIQKLKDKKYDICFLDHDLGEKEMVDSFGEEETGYTVALWIAENKPEIPLIVVHSHNPAGSNNMAALLKNSGYFVAQVPFMSLVASVEQLLNWKPPVD